eukprot:comp17885_c0_seq1/m.18116 comp17885_c0_seq1/g.18116  ORF comp17885_c0_seq1/g.18116 comp17885_c0_seq1/m.18116 type:complete len:843 (-) comp17885_c0_seq1:265-2793(-)
MFSVTPKMLCCTCSTTTRETVASVSEFIATWLATRTLNLEAWMEVKKYLPFLFIKSSECQTESSDDLAKKTSNVATCSRKLCTPQRPDLIHADCSSPSGCHDQLVDLLSLSVVQLIFAAESWKNNDSVAGIRRELHNADLIPLYVMGRMGCVDQVIAHTASKCLTAIIVGDTQRKLLIQLLQSLSRTRPPSPSPSSRSQEPENRKHEPVFVSLSSDNWPTFAFNGCTVLKGLLQIWCKPPEAGDVWATAPFSTHPGMKLLASWLPALLHVFLQQPVGLHLVPFLSVMGKMVVADHHAVVSVLSPHLKTIADLLGTDAHPAVKKKVIGLLRKILAQPACSPTMLLSIGQSLIHQSHQVSALQHCLSVGPAESSDQPFAHEEQLTVQRKCITLLLSLVESGLQILCNNYDQRQSINRGNKQDIENPEKSDEFDITNGPHSKRVKLSNDNNEVSKDHHQYSHEQPIKHHDRNLLPIETRYLQGNSLGSNQKPSVVDDTALAKMIVSAIEQATSCLPEFHASTPPRVLCRTLLQCVGEEDDVCVDTLWLTARAHVHFQRLQTLHRDNSPFNLLASNPLVEVIATKITPNHMFAGLLDLIGYDHEVLLDWLTAQETAFLEYFLQYLKQVPSNWSDFVTAWCGASTSHQSRTMLQEVIDYRDANSGSRSNTPASPKLHHSLPVETPREKSPLHTIIAGSESENGTEEDTNESDRIEDAMDCLIRLSLKIEALSEKGVLPYPAGPLLSRLAEMENLYEASAPPAQETDGKIDFEGEGDYVHVQETQQSKDEDGSGGCGHEGKGRMMEGRGIDVSGTGWKTEAQNTTGTTSGEHLSALDMLCAYSGDSDG